VKSETFAGDKLFESIVDGFQWMIASLGQQTRKSFEEKMLSSPHKTRNSSIIKQRKKKMNI
jgi:hypothetical protein